MTDLDLQTTTWDNSHIYTSFEDQNIQSDIQYIEKTTKEIAELSKSIEPTIETIDSTADEKLKPFLEGVKKISLLQKEAYIKLWTLSVFSSSRLSTESQDLKAKELSSKCSSLGAELSKAATSKDLFLMRCSDNLLNEFLEDPKTSEFKFNLLHGRKQKDFLLSVKEESLSTGLATDGLHAWGKLYSSLSGSIKVQVGEEEMGLAKASALLRQGDRYKRELAWKGINHAWETHEESAGAILNSINGWRIEQAKVRSTKRQGHYLDKSCHQSRIERSTLDALMETTHKRRDVGHKALRIMAKAEKLDKLAPWDLLAPAPESGEPSPTPFPKAIEMISHAFSEFSPDMGEFAKMMTEKNWIDATPTTNRAPGAYCTKFPNVREPRIFMTYTGTMGNIITLAHELGHAYHNWVMRDLSLSEAAYSMTLAETASIFAETLVRETILEECKTDEEKIKILWQEAESAAALMINIPARYEFEKMMVEERMKGNLPPSRLKELMSSAWEKWYGNTLTEYDQMFWASKLHFSISSLGFYNYPYLFGYLFSLGIYSQKDNDPQNFAGLYKDILRDTGTMTAEDLVQKHLGQNISDEKFWDNSINIVEKTINQLESLL